MKKIIMCVIIVVLLFSTLYYVKFRYSDIKLAYCSATDNKLYIYNVKNKTSDEVKTKNNSTAYAIGGYSLGDYCYAFTDDNGNDSIALVSENNITNIIKIPFHPMEIIATNEIVFCHVDEKIYAVNISDNNSKIYTEDVCCYDGYQKMFLSGDKNLYYISKSSEGSTSLMNVNENGKNTICNNIRSAFGFVSNSKFVYKDYDGNMKVVNVYNDKFSSIKKYGKICGPISASNSIKIITGYYSTGESGGFATLKVVDLFSGIRFKTSLDNYQVLGSVVVF